MIPAVALRYDIDPAQRLVVITGEYADAVEWQQLLAALLNDPRREPGLAFLRDLRGGGTPVDASTVVDIVTVVRRFWPLFQPSRAAIVTANPLDTAALVAHALADSQGLPIELFTSYDAALEWLFSNEPPRHPRSASYS